MKNNEDGSYAHGPPWIFKGRALYQLSLVKADAIRRLIPSELKLVEAFGYTLGGLYFAQYDSSPAGKFNELVLLAGIVWNPPTSCAWAARVLVDSESARDHGIKEVGLPSRLATFSPLTSSQLEAESWLKSGGKTDLAFEPSAGLDVRSSFEKNSSSKRSPSQTASLNPASTSLLSRILGGLTAPQLGGGKKALAPDRIRASVDVMDVDGGQPFPLCRIMLPAAMQRKGLDESSVWPRVKMSLPSFSGKTDAQPNLLKYSCQLQCGICVTEPGLVLTTDENKSKEDKKMIPKLGEIGAILKGKPIVTFLFDGMTMKVEAPTLVSLDSNIVTPAIEEKKVVVAS